MQTDKPSIFRDKAFDYYVQARGQAVIPRLVSPRGFNFLWGMLLVLCVVGGVVLFTHIPYHAAATAIIVEDTQHGKAILLIVDPSDAARMRIGYKVHLPNSRYGTIVRVNPIARSAHTIQSQYEVGDTRVTQFGATALAIPEHDSAFEPGAVYSVFVETDTRPLYALLPILETLDS